MAFATKLDLTNDKFCQRDGGILTLSGDTYISSVGVIKYSTDQSGSYTTRSLVDKGYVTGLTTPLGTRITTIEGSYLSGVTNGLTVTNRKVKLGGALTGNTTITGAYTLNFCTNAKLNTQCGYQISGVTMFRTAMPTLTSIYIGCQAGSNGTGTNNLGVGYQSLQAIVAGTDNASIGYRSLYSTTSGSNNIGIGSSSLYSNTCGSNNVAFGNQALFYNSCGNNNNAQGSSALSSNQCGSDNLSLGQYSLYSNVNGSNNIGFGCGSGYLSTGSLNMYFGRCAGYSNTTDGKLYIATGVTRNLIYGDFSTNQVVLPILKLCTTPATGVNSDKLMVWNSTDCCVKTIDGSVVLSCAITGATNGLTKVGQMVKLGGNLTGNTSIGLSLKTMCFNGLYSNLYLNDKCPTDASPGYNNMYYVSTSGATCTVSTLYEKYGQNCLAVCNPNSPNNSKAIDICWTGDMRVVDTVCSKGLVYPTNYCANFSKYSLVDKNYVTGQTTTAGIQSANNGLTKSGTNVRMGGALTGATTITGAYALSFCNASILECTSGNIDLRASGTAGICSTGIATILGSCVCMSGLANYNADYSGSFVPRSLVDKAYVTGLTSTYICSANNGLTKSGQNVRLGGTLTGNTIINGATYNLCLGLSGGLLGAYTLCSTSVLECTSGNIDLRASGTAGICSTGIMTINGSCVSVNALANYNSNYSASFVPRSLVDKGYVTGITSQLGIQCASNGLTKSGLNVCLGGTLTGNTTINGVYQMNFGTSGSTLTQFNVKAACTLISSTTSTILNGAGYVKVCPIGCADITPTGILNIGGSVVNVCNFATYNTNYCSSFTKYSLVDKNYVTGLTSSISTNYLCTANNGLTKSGNNVRLGGALTGTTTITGAYDLGITSCLYADNVEHFGFINNVVSPITCNTLYLGGCALNFNREFAGVTLQIGEETVTKVINHTGSLISNGTIVYFNGAYGGIPTIAKPIASSSIEYGSYGVATMNIADNNEGYVTAFGAVNGVDTSTWIVGTAVYLSPTIAGTFTCTQPVYPNRSILMGVVTLQDAVNGRINVDSHITTPYTTIGTFNAYTACTQTVLNCKISCTCFNTYTGNTASCFTCYNDVVTKAVTGGTNGLGKTGRNACLGGTLISSTTICGVQPLKFGDLNGITLSTQNTTDIGLNAKSNGGVYLKSQSGVVDSVSDFTTSIGFAADYNAVSGFALYDNRVGVNRTGIVYASDYSSAYVNRSLVDKQYVDSVAVGLNAHAAVLVATTGNTVLSGLLTIDGVVLTTGDRVLVKSQTAGALNGIYSASTGTWGRTDDYNFFPSGEISNGDMIPVLTGVTNANSVWILVTVNPIVSGNTLTYTKFSQQIGIVDGSGINVTTSGLNKVVSVELGTNSGLQFAGTGLVLDWTKFRVGLCCTAGGYVDARVSKCVVVGNEIPVAINTGGTNVLYIDSSTLSTCIGTPIICANNGLTKTGNNVRLGGTLTGDTTIDGSSGAYDLCLTCLDSFNLSYDNGAVITDNGGSPCGLRYASNYGLTYVDRSLIDKRFLNDTLTGTSACRVICYNNGIKNNINSKYVSWGGALTGDTSITHGANRFCIISNGTSCMDMISDCSQIHVENASLCLRSCTNGTCLATVCIGNTGIISLSSNAATCGIRLTSPSTGAIYNADYSSTFINESLVTKRYVTGLTTTSGVQSANNGLTKSGTNVRLGGALTGNTTITGAYTVNFCTNTKLNTQCGYQISGVTMFRTAMPTLTSIYIGCSAGSNGTGIHNLGIGYQSMTGNTSGTENIGFGAQSLLKNTIGSYNIAMGSLSMGNNLSGAYNTSLGYWSLLCNVSGCNNVAIGKLSLPFNSTGSENVSLGCSSLYCNDSGCNNIAHGQRSLFANKTGSNNIGFGLRALYLNCCNSDNIGIGQCAGYNSSGSTNVYIGKCAGFNNTTSSKLYIAMGATCNLIYGDFATNEVVLPILKLCTTPATGLNTDKLVVWNSTDCCIKTVDGSAVLSNAITGATNGLTKVGQMVKLGGALTGNTTISGAYTLNFCTNAKVNTQCGYQISGVTMFRTAMPSLLSIYVGCLAGSNGSGIDNFGVGYQSLCSNTTGSNNIAIGCNSLGLNTIGSYNIAHGLAALYCNVSGCHNIAQGQGALNCNNTGCNNIAQGMQSLNHNTIGNNNIAQGFSALACNSCGCNNVAIGCNSLILNTSGSYNIAQGNCTLSSNITGYDNIGFGQYAGYSNTGSLNMYFGKCAGYSNTTDGKLYIATGVTRNLIYGDFSLNEITLPKLKLCTTPATGLNTDKLIVWNTTDCCIKVIDGGAVLSSAITGATNGLTKVGQVVKLGGTLTGNTTIADGGYAFCHNGTGSFNTCTACVNSTAGTGGNTYTKITQTNLSLNLLQCDSIGATCSSIGLTASEICMLPKTNAVINAGTNFCAWAGGATKYSCFTANCSSASMTSTNTTSTAYVTASGLLGTTIICGISGITLNSTYAGIGLSSVCVNLTGVAKLCSTPSTGVITDGVLVWNSSDKIVKQVAGSALGDRNNIYSKAVITASSGLTTNAPYLILVNHTVPVTVTLPLTPIDGEAFKIKDASSGGALTNNVTISRNGKSIDRGANDALINTDGGAIEFVYDSSLLSWFSLSFIN